MKIVSWNVAGIRAILKKNALDFTINDEIDIICFQETKAEQTQVKLSSSFLNFYPYQTWNHSKNKKGYSGTAIWSRHPFVSIIPTPHFDTEGRICAVEYTNFYLITVYTPNSKRDLSRLKERIDVWDTNFRQFCNNLDNKKSCIICGDFNVCHKDIDIHKPDQHRGNIYAGFTAEEQTSFDLLLSNSFVDTFRLFNNEGGNYTWWSYIYGARKKNIGWRLDYFLVSQDVKHFVKSSSILKNILGSDHCPIFLDFDLKTEMQSSSHAIDIHTTSMRRRSYSYPTPPDVKEMIQITKTKRGNLP